MSELQLIYKDTAGVPEGAIQKLAPMLDAYHSHLSELRRRGDYPEPSTFVNTPFDTDVYEQVIELCNQLTSEKLRYVFVVGIGGSSLGAKAVYDAVMGAHDAHLSSRQPKLIFLETLDIAGMRHLSTLIESIEEPEAVAMCVITKSGETTETLANFETLYALLSQHHGADMAHRTMAISDEDTPFLITAKERGFHTLSVPPAVSGRYSVFTAVGLLPLMLSGVDVSGLLRGARTMTEQCLSGTESENPARITAALWYVHAQNDIRIHNTFFFNPALESLGKWQRQLIAESIGKRSDNEGNEVRAGILPAVSIGSTDLHSMVQLYLGGPRNIFTTFVSAPPAGNHVAVPSSETAIFADHATHTHGKSFADIMEAIRVGTQTTYEHHELPYAHIKLSEAHPEMIGAFMQMQMIAVADLAYLLHIDAFDQPLVEDYKTETRRRLTQ